MTTMTEEFGWDRSTLYVFFSEHILAGIEIAAECYLCEAFFAIWNFWDYLACRRASVRSSILDTKAKRE